MSELINSRDNRATIRWKLLTSASVLAVTAHVSSANIAKAEEVDRALIWVELGGQMENISDQGEVFTPAFLSVYPTSPVLQKITPIGAQQPQKFSFGEEGKISFQPEGSDWIFSAALRYGRSSNHRHVDHQTNRVFETYSYNLQRQYITTVAKFADTHSQRRESHTVLDFAVGKDVGLGMLGGNSSSVVGLGVRFAQFASGAAFNIRARPDMHVKYLPTASGMAHAPLPYFHTYHATGHASRSFRGIGPSLSWNGSAPFAGNSRDSELTVDWGLNAAILFGRQKSHVRHQESAHYEKGKYALIGRRGDYELVYHHPSSGHLIDGHDTNRLVIAPNIGGFAGMSLKFPNAKVSLGYRADFFFGAIDGGIDTRKSTTLGFNGPFASISVGFP